MKRFLAWATCLAFALPSCPISQPQPAQPAAQSNSSDYEIYKAVILYQIKSWDLAADSFCIEINGRDADQILLDRLHSWRVKKASACKKKRLSLGGIVNEMQVIDRKSKKNSVIFDLEAIRRKNESEAEVEGGYVCASLCMAGGIYHAVHDQIGWHVIGFDAQIMS